MSDNIQINTAGSSRSTTADRNTSDVWADSEKVISLGGGIYQYPAGIDENTIVTLTFEPDGSGVSVSIGGETINTVPKNNDKALWD